MRKSYGFFEPDRHHYPNMSETFVGVDNITGRLEVLTSVGDIALSIQEPGIHQTSVTRTSDLNVAARRFHIGKLMQLLQSVTNVHA